MMFFDLNFGYLSYKTLQRHKSVTSKSEQMFFHSSPEYRRRLPRRSQREEVSWNGRAFRRRTSLPEDRRALPGRGAQAQASAAAPDPAPHHPAG